MSRDWFAVYTNMMLKPKFRCLSPTERGALFQIWLLAGFQDPEAMWSDRRTLEESLRLDGWDGDIKTSILDAGEIVTRFLDLRWLDVDEEGRVWVHDWDHHQRAVTEKVRTAYERERKADYRWRLRTEKEDKPSLSKNSLSEGQGKKRKHKTVSRDVPDMSRTECVSCHQEIVDLTDVIVFGAGEHRHQHCPVQEAAA